jgi:predicted AlkP superfamily phosphohydrolase/phosphomutase
VTEMSGKIVLIGLDSADIEYLEASLPELPCLRRLFGGAVIRRLETPAEVMSAAVWPTFYTGKPPGEHGHYFPMQWDPSRMRLRHVSEDWLACEPFWRPLAREGLRVTTLDVQVAFPARTPHGAEVVHWSVEQFGGFHCNQPRIAREIVRRFGTNPMRYDAPVDKSEARLAEMRTELLDSVRRRGELARWLARETDWRLFVAVFTEIHRAGHYFWPGAAAGEAGTGAWLREVHQAVDREIGALLDAVGQRETTVIVFSLLGMGRNN